MTRALALLCRTGRRLRDDSSGLAMLEFAFVMPILLAMILTGSELTNYIITRMRVSQIALHIADNAARAGTGSQLEAKKLSELDINDLFTGAGLQGGELELYDRGRVTLSSVEEDAAHAGKYKIRWQRCKGNKTGWGSAYTAGQDNLTDVGPANQKVTAPPQGATMYVEVRYEYRPLIKTSLSPSSEIKEIASMMVRDRRDLSDDTKLPNGTTNPNPTHPNGVYKVAGVTPSNC